ncbi:hypothetical protein ACFVMC_30385 [Nocardia sp. NPDC127579]|uniref:hypothetical protein n=1 Tax=Nocardia sp. NPDC127579 TaxID=3345402 RepID=UPI0036419688
MEMIPDPADRTRAFEPLLDSLLATFGADREPSPGVSGAGEHHRCEVKRFRLGQAADADAQATRSHADRLLHVAVHDQCRSGINQLIRPLVRVLGYRPVQERLVRYLREGSEPEQIGATMAWYWAQPPLGYDSWEDARRGIPSKSSQAEQDSLNDLHRQFRTACLAAFLARDSPDTRHALSIWLTLDPADYPGHLRADHTRACEIIRADPDRYRRPS